MKLRALLLFVLWTLFCVHSIGQMRKGYLVYTERDNTVTCYDDGKMSSQTGTAVLEMFDIDNIGCGISILDKSILEKVVRVIFDPSFINAKYRNLTNFFHGMKNLTTIEGLRYFDTSEVINARSVFLFCYSLTTIDLSSLSMPKLKNASGMFAECGAKTIKLFKSGNQISLTERMFLRDHNLESIVMNNLNTSQVTSMESMFYECSSLTSIDLSSFDTGNVINMKELFWECSSLTSIDLSSFDTGNVTNMQNMFAYCKSLTTVDVNYLDTHNVNNMIGMFVGCDALKTISNVSGVTQNYISFDTSNVVDMSGMFSGCDGLEYLDLSDFNTSNVVSFEYMFQGCERLVKLALSGFDTRKVKNTSYMFLDCKNLKTIFVGGKWTMASVSSDTDMFRNCNALIGGAGTSYSLAHIGKAYAHIDGGTSNPGYFTEPMYDLWVGGIQVKGRNQSDVLGDGKVSYLPGSKKLKLNNATITLTGFDNCIMNDNPQYVNGGIDGLTIEVEGTCFLTAEASAILINQNTTITGNGELIVKSNGDAAVNVNQSILTCKVKRLYAYAIKEGLVGDFGYNTKLVINGSTLECYTNTPKTFKPIKGFYSMTLTNCHFADPGGEWKYADASKFSYSTNNNGGVLFNGSDYRGKVLIEPNTVPTKYRLWVGETRVTSANKNNIGGLVSGTAVFNSDTHTLTLNSAVMRIDRYDDGIANGLENLEGMPDFKIVCKGTNSIETEGNGLSLYGNTTISGSKLSVKTGNYGVYLDDFKELTLQDADVYTEAPNPIFCGYNTFVYVRHSQLEANPGTSRNCSVEGAREFDLFDCKYADPGIGINPAYLYYNEEEKMIYYDRSPYIETLLVVPTGNISTDIDSLDNGDLGIDKSLPLYNLNGQRVSHPVKGQIYIQNGRKIKF